MPNFRLVPTVAANQRAINARTGNTTLSEGADGGKWIMALLLFYGL